VQPSTEHVSSGEEKDQQEMVIERRLSQALITGDHLIKVQLVQSAAMILKLLLHLFGCQFIGKKEGSERMYE